MNKEAQFKLAVSILVVVIILIFLGVYFGFIHLGSFFGSDSIYNTSVTPSKIVTPNKGFVPDTEIHVYDTGLPPGFPTAILIEDKPIIHSAEVRAPEGKKQIIVSYISDKSIIDVANAYVSSLTKQNWNITTKNIEANVSVIAGKQQNKDLVLTISPAPNNQGTLVTFQYAQ